MGKRKMIVVPTDFSETSARVLSVALDYASLLGGRIVLVHVHDAPAYLGLDAGAVADVEKGMQQRIERELEEVAEQVRRRGVEVEQVRLYGSSPEAIAEFARRAGADLIVMGTHGRGGIKHALLGSMAEHVIPRSPCPVMVVPPPLPPSPDGDGAS